MSFDKSNVWQDHQVLFNCSKSEFIFGNGEETYKTMSNIEDLKGNEIGTFIFTNLRLIWYNNKDPKINQSIGYDCIENLEKRTSDSMMTGQSNILSINCKVDKSRYELEYRHLSDTKNDPYINLKNILKLYEEGRIYREMKQNTLDILDKDNKNLILLKNEKMMETYKNISININNEGDAINKKVGNTGTLYLTNIRIIWINDKKDNYNLTLPYIQISSVRGENHPSYGISIKIKLTKLYNNFIILFYSSNNTMDEQFCEDFRKQIEKFLKNPIVGISLLKKGDGVQDKLKEKIKKIADIVYGQEEISDKNEDEQAGMVYLINEGRNKQNSINDIEFSKELGIACQKLPDNVTINDLWKIVK